MLETFEGIIINETKYGETSKIINILTCDNKVIGCYCKGANLLKNHLRNQTNIFTHGQFIMKYNKDKMSNLNDVTIINNYKNIKKDIIKIGYANYILDLINQVYKHGTSDFLFDYLKTTLNKIDEGLNPKIITSILELKCLNNLGVAPNLDSCVNCNSKKSIATISSYYGGFVCNNCLKDEKIVNEKTIKLIRMFSLIDIDKIDKIDISKDIEIEIDNFIEDYYSRYTGLYLKSKAFLKSIIK